MKRFPFSSAESPILHVGSPVTPPFIHSNSPTKAGRHLKRLYGIPNSLSVYIPPLFNEGMNIATVGTQVVQQTGLTSTGLPATNGQPLIYRICVSPNGELFLLAPKNSSGTGSTTNSVLRYPTATTWANIAVHPVTGEWGWAWCVEDGRIYTVGTNVYMYKPSTNTWSASLGASGLTFNGYFVTPNFYWKGKMFGYNGTNLYRFTPPNTFTVVSNFNVLGGLTIHYLSSIQVGDLAIFFQGLQQRISIFSLETEKWIYSKQLPDDLLVSSYRTSLYTGGLIYKNGCLYLNAYLAFDLTSGSMFHTANQPMITYNPTIPPMSGAYGSQTFMLPQGYAFAEISYQVSGTYYTYWYLFKLGDNYYV